MRGLQSPQDHIHCDMGCALEKSSTRHTPKGSYSLKGPRKHLRDLVAFQTQTPNRSVLLERSSKQCQVQSRLHWGRSNLVEPAEWPKIGLRNRDFGSILSIFPAQSSLNFLQSGPRRFTKSDFSGLAPIQRVLTSGGFSCG